MKPAPIGYYRTSGKGSVRKKRGRGPKLIRRVLQSMEQKVRWSVIMLA